MCIAACLQRGQHLRCDNPHEALEDGAICALQVMATDSENRPEETRRDAGLQARVEDLCQERPHSFNALKGAKRKYER